MCISRDKPQSYFNPRFSAKLKTLKNKLEQLTSERLTNFNC